MSGKANDERLESASVDHQSGLQASETSSLTTAAKASKSSKGKGKDVGQPGDIQSNPLDSPGGFDLFRQIASAKLGIPMHQLPFQAVKPRSSAPDPNQSGSTSNSSVAVPSGSHTGADVFYRAASGKLGISAKGMPAAERKMLFGEVAAFWANSPAGKVSNARNGSAFHTETGVSLFGDVKTNIELADGLFRGMLTQELGRTMLSTAKTVAEGYGDDLMPLIVAKALYDVQEAGTPSLSFGAASTSEHPDIASYTCSTCGDAHYTEKGKPVKCPQRTSCSYCGSACRTPANTRNHEANVCPAAPPEVKELRLGVEQAIRKYRCPRCPMAFLYKHSMQKHVGTDRCTVDQHQIDGEGRGKYRCKLCFARSNKERNSRRHEGNNTCRDNQAVMAETGYNLETGTYDKN